MVVSSRSSFSSQDKITIAKQKTGFVQTSFGATSTTAAGRIFSLKTVQLRKASCNKVSVCRA